MAEKGNESQSAIDINIAVESVVRKFVRLLVGRISLTKLQEMIRFVYVDEAEKSLVKTPDSSKTPLTKLALVTGLDTRTLNRLRSEVKNKNGEEYREQYLTTLTPESAIVEAWAEKVRHSSSSLYPRTMSYGDSDSEFEQLVKSTISTRGITTRSIIKRLLDTKSIKKNKKEKTLTLLVSKFSPYLSDNEESLINAAFVSIGSLLSTIENNVNKKPENRFFQRQIWTMYLDPKSLESFRKHSFEMLERYESMAEIEITPWEENSSEEKLLTAGVGFYYFEDTKAGI